MVVVNHEGSASIAESTSTRHARPENITPGLEEVYSGHSELDSRLWRGYAVGRWSWCRIRRAPSSQPTGQRDRRSRRAVKKWSSKVSRVEAVDVGDNCAGQDTGGC